MTAQEPRRPDTPTTSPPPSAPVGERPEAALEAAEGERDVEELREAFGWPIQVGDSPEDAVDADAVPERQPRRPRPWWHTALRVLALIVVAAVVVAVLWGNIPSPAEIWAALLTANFWWILLAAALQMVSLGMFARQQRRLLKAFGVRMSIARAEAITYGSSALTNSLPAGGAVSAGWSFQQYRARGASSATAATVMVLSGVLSIGALLGLYGIGALAAGWTRLTRLAEDHPVGAMSIGLTVLAVLVVLIRLVADRKEVDLDAPTPKLDRYEQEHARIGAAVRQVVTTLRQARRVSFVDWNLALGTTAAKWLLDAGCLWASCEAFGISIDVFKLSALYLGIQLVRQVPLTPGGIGVIEVALLAGLVSAGAPEGPAAAAVLVYRMLSAWLIIPIGYLVMALMVRWDRRHAAPAAIQPASEPQSGRTTST